LVRFLEASTFYARHGDVAATVSIIATIALLAWPSVIRRGRVYNERTPCPQSTI
jgi:hypothetical protein